MEDKYTAVWVSHTSIGDFLICPRAYFLKNIYKDPRSGHKIQLMSPPLALGQAVHEVLEGVSALPVKDRFRESLLSRFRTVWQKVGGRQGGFTDPAGEKKYYERGEKMLRRVMASPGPLARLAVKIKMELPWYWLSGEEGIILCGKIDWLEYLEDQKAVRIIDFKTGQGEEEAGSLQLPIYSLLASHCQQYPVQKSSYWYLGRHDAPTEIPLPNLKKTGTEVLAIAKKIKLARQLEHFKCPQGEAGCRACRPYEKIVQGKAEFVGINDFGQDIYLLDQSSEDNQGKAEIL